MFVCSGKRMRGGGRLRVNMHHCGRLIFHQTARSMQRLPPPLDTTVCRTGGLEKQEISSSREEEGGSWEEEEGGGL